MGAAGATAVGKDPLGGKRKQQALKLYWDQLSQVVSDEAVAVWVQLERDCVNMKEVLNRRTELVETVDALAKKNTELKTTLNRYLGDSKNSLLQIPPAQTIRVRNPVLSNTSKVTGGNKLIPKKPDIKKLMSQTK